MTLLRLIPMCGRAYHDTRRGSPIEKPASLSHTLILPVQSDRGHSSTLANHPRMRRLLPGVLACCAARRGRIRK